MLEAYYTFLGVMAVVAVIVFVALHFVEAGYGYLFDARFGRPVSNKVGWVLMESPVFVAMCLLWALSDVRFEAAPLVLFLLFQTHYFHRSFIFPMRLRGNSKMPLGIVVMGMLFNTLNALMQGGWIFYLAPEGFYDDWFSKPQIYIGAAIFIAGMAINLHSDHIIRTLRKPGDTGHYIPYGGMFRYVTSANYFGELTEENAKFRLPSFIMGDMNARPESETIQLTRDYTDMPLTDLTESIETSFHRFGKSSGTKIDYIFADADTAKGLVSVKVWDTSNFGLYLSDHYPVEAIVELND